MSLVDIHQGIAAIQSGNLMAGAEFLRRGLTDQSITGDTRAVALMWLAYTSPQVSYKIECYKEALAHSPNNVQAQQGLNELLKSQIQQAPMPQAQSIPTPPSHTPAPQPTHTTNAPRLWEFGVTNGPNGIGTAFLVVRDGMLATARFVVGTHTHVKVTSRDGDTFNGEVMRSYPELDLAFIKIDLRVAFIRDFTPSTLLAPDTPLVADDYTEDTIHGRCLEIQSQPTKKGWFRTSFQDNLPSSFNGAPIIDEEQDIVGMLTRNSIPNTRQLYGLHISTIRAKVEEFYTEMHTQPHERVYCGCCGNRSEAGGKGLYYCEYCGRVLHFAERLQRTPHPHAKKYYK